MGERLRNGLEQIVKQHDGIRAIRNAGFFLVSTWGPKRAAAAGRRAMALDVVNAMRDDGVLIARPAPTRTRSRCAPRLFARANTSTSFLRR